MTPTEEHLVRSLVDLTTRTSRGRLTLGEADCKTLAWLYLCEPGYVRWDGSARLVCTMYQLLSDPQAVGRRRRPLASVSARIKWGPYDRSRGDRATNTGGSVEVGVAREEPAV